MFNNKGRIRQIEELYLYLLKYRNFGVYSVDKAGDSYLVTLARKTPDGNFIPLYNPYILAPVLEVE